MSFSHEKVETSNWLMIVLILLVVAVGGLVEIVPLFFQKSTTTPVAGLVPDSPLRLVGRDIYLREGCYNCHSQMVRPLVAETLRGAANAPAPICTAWAASTATSGSACT
jgi:cytochrome c oxidase cbb3-type subunit 2